MLLEFLKIPPIVQDEDILGWFHAIADANGWDHASFMTAFFPDCRVPPRDDRYKTNKPFLYHIANYTKYYALYVGLRFPSPQEMLMEHTAIPVCGLFTGPVKTGLLAETVLNGHNVKTGPGRRLRIQMNGEDILARPAFRYCPLCVKEDMEEHGRPVVHVPHQGWDRGGKNVNVCYRHGLRLDPLYKIPQGGSPPRPVTGWSTARDVANLVETMYRARAVGDVTDIAYVIDVPGHDGGDGMGGTILDDVSRLDRDLVLRLYDKSGRHGELADRAAAVMACNCNDVELLGYSPFPFMRYRCGSRRAESVSYILSLTSGMTCRLCGRYWGASGG